MPNHRYQRGRAAEYRSIAVLEKLGYSAVRAAGSHGVFDVVGWDGAEFVMVQVKSGTGPSRAELVAMSEEVVPPNATKLIHFWHKVKGRLELQETEVA